MSKVIKKPTRTKKRKPLLVVTQSLGMTNDPKRCDDVRKQAAAIGYDVIVLPAGVAAYVSVTA
jgi:hypothetical protein